MKMKSRNYKYLIMKKFFMLLALSLAFVAGTSAEERSKSYKFGDIAGIDAGFTYEIHVTEGASKSVEVIYDSEYEEYMRVTYSSFESKLYLSMDELPRKIRNNNHPHVRVYLEMDYISEIDLSGASSISFDGSFTAKNLEMDLSGASRVGGQFTVNGRSLSLDASGAAKAYVTGDFPVVDLDLSGAASVTLTGSGTTMDGELSGASKFSLEGNYDNCGLECSGAANLRMSGKGDTFELEGSGACDINAKDYAVKSAFVELSGASKAKVNVAEVLQIDVDRACKLTYYGSPEIRNISADNNIIQGSL